MTTGNDNRQRNTGLWWCGEWSVQPQLAAAGKKHCAGVYRDILAVVHPDAAGVQPVDR